MLFLIFLFFIYVFLTRQKIKCDTKVTRTNEVNRFDSNINLWCNFDETLMHLREFTWTRLRKKKEFSSSVRVTKRTLFEEGTARESKTSLQCS